MKEPRVCTSHHETVRRPGSELGSRRSAVGILVRERETTAAGCRAQPVTRGAMPSGAQPPSSVGQGADVTDNKSLYSRSSVDSPYQNDYEFMRPAEAPVASVQVATATTAETPPRIMVDTPQDVSAITRPTVVVPPAPTRMKQFWSGSIKEWLECLDESGFLLQYHDHIISRFASVDSIIDECVKVGEMDKQFFADAGIKKLGHKRLFEKWVKENCC